MRPEVLCPNETEEFETPELCSILEVANDEGDADVSISRARVSPGTTTAWHRLKGTAERYIVVAGTGQVEIDDVPATNVGPGCVVRIPPNTPQRITNIGETDLIFFCICTPPFSPQCYEHLHPDSGSPGHG